MSSIEFYFLKKQKLPQLNFLHLLQIAFEYWIFLVTSYFSHFQPRYTFELTLQFEAEYPITPHQPKKSIYLSFRFCFFSSNVFIIRITFCLARVSRTLCVSESSN